MGRFVKNRELEQGALSVEIPQVSTAKRPAGQNGQIIYNTTTSTYQGDISSAWHNISTANSPLGTVTIDKFQGDGSTTIFGNNKGNTLDGSTQANLSFSVTDEEDILVFVGGVYQIPDTNYTVSGNTITFGSAPPGDNGVDNSHIITIIHKLNAFGE